MNAHRPCSKCCGEAVLYMSGQDVLRVSARKDKYGEVEDGANGKTKWLCNECRFEKKAASDWTIEGPRHIERHSVIAQNHYEKQKQLKIDVSNQKQISEKAHNS
jgi:NADH-quinone oxidoreductase subunit G